jgi:hypothetical protein
MHQRSSTMGRELFRTFSSAVAVCGLATGGTVMAQAAGDNAKASHGPVEIQVIASGGALPPAPWKCDPKAGAFTICVSEEPISLTGEPPARSIPWQIKTKGWSFVPGTGLTFSTGGWSVHPASPTNWVAKGQKDGTTIKYTISVTNGTAPPVSWDPRIINN